MISSYIVVAAVTCRRGGVGSEVCVCEDFAFVFDMSARAHSFWLRFLFFLLSLFSPLALFSIVKHWKKSAWTRFANLLRIDCKVLLCRLPNTRSMTARRTFCSVASFGFCWMSKGSITFCIRSINCSTVRDLYSHFFDNRRLLTSSA